MRINLVLADNVELDPTLDITKLKDIGSLWGGWRTWRSCSTDNVICHDVKKAKELLQRAFQSVCNFYLPRSSYQMLNSPIGVKLYDGDFNQDVDCQDEIVAMHLAASQSDLILLFGFNWSEQGKHTDKLYEHRAGNYRHLTKQIIIGNPEIQWVLIDHTTPIRKALETVDNLTCDSLDNVFDLLQ